MTAHLLTFCNKRFQLANKWLRQSAYSFGIQQQFYFTDVQFRQSKFYHAHKAITAEPFWAGLYLWKPYSLLEVLHQLKEGDVVV